MKNKFNETGLEFGNTLTNATKSRNSSSISKEQINQFKAQWPYPEESKKLILWLMGHVNSKEEYEQLQKELAELEILISSDSSKMKGGAE
jgi:hypothetical protein